jgi:hypothetical protein
MLGRIVASTVLAVALTQGAAFAQANSDNSNLPAQNSTTSSATQSVTPSAQSEASPSSTQSSDQAQQAAPSNAQAQQYSQANEQAQQTPSNAQAQTSAEANAQSQSTPSSQVASNETNQQPIPQEIRQKLQNMGFSDVQVVPGSFIVSAKDKDGDPVSMIIGPHSTTLFSVITPDNNQQQAQR